MNRFLEFPQHRAAVASTTRMFTCRFATLLIVASVSTSAVPSWALATGDIAIIGAHCDHPDSFAWVALADLPAGQVVFFTDAGWFSGLFGGQNTASDGGIRYVVPVGGVQAGAVHTVPISGALPFGYSHANEGVLGPQMMTGHFGDQIAVFTGSPDNPQFIFALNTNSSNWGVSNQPNYSAESQLYPGLIDGITAVATGAGSAPGQEVDNSFYTGFTAGDKLNLLTVLGDPNEWEDDNDPVSDITNGTEDDGGFFVLPGAEPEFRQGDFSVNGSADIGDAIAHLVYLFLGQVHNVCEYASDTNDDGITNITDDIVLLQVLVLGLGSIPSPGFVNCGVDPTNDNLGCEVYPLCE